MVERLVPQRTLMCLQTFAKSQSPLFALQGCKIKKQTPLGLPPDRQPQSE